VNSILNCLITCVGIKYEDLAYGVAHGFATMGTNNGHNGTTAASFYQNDEVAVDFACRAYVFSPRPAAAPNQVLKGGSALQACTRASSLAKSWPRNSTTTPHLESHITSGAPSGVDRASKPQSSFHLTLTV
jgi:hypothetical protein